jgi:hypothetical protein
MGPMRCPDQRRATPRFPRLESVLNPGWVRARHLSAQEGERHGARTGPGHEGRAGRLRHEGVAPVGTRAACGSRTGGRTRSSRSTSRGTARSSAPAVGAAAGPSTGYAMDACSSPAATFSASSLTRRASDAPTYTMSHRTAGARSLSTDAVTPASPHGLRLGQIGDPLQRRHPSPPFERQGPRRLHLGELPRLRRAKLLAAWRSAEFGGALPLGSSRTAATLARVLRRVE